MVGVINPRDSTPLDDFRNRAKNTSFMLQPGEQWPAESQGQPPGPGQPPPSQSQLPTTSSSSSSTTSLPTITVPAVAPTPTPVGNSNSQLGAGGIAGVSLGSAAVVALIGALFFVLGRRKTEGTHAGLGSEKPPSMYPHPASPSGGPRGSAGFGGAYDPSGYPPRSVGTASPLGDEQKPYGWRSSRQSTLRGRPVEMSSNDVGHEDPAATIREPWSYMPPDSLGSPVYPPPPPHQHQPQSQQQQQQQQHPPPPGMPPATYHSLSPPSGPPSTNADAAPPTNGAAVAGSAIEPGRYRGSEQH